MATKRAYKLQEFVAHASSVNCLKIGRKSSRVLLTGGEDHKVNLWAIGKPNSILSLSGHTSAVESVSFDSSEVLVAAGAASGTIKLWDLEEAKLIRTLTGHRSNCISVDFHPFGEFFASGSLDTNLKIWDMRRKGCIHTYKGHTRGVNAIRFTPDGRWVVSGGEDSIVKLWDLTAGKLLHDFKCHEAQIQCIDFHPHEFLLATGSADRTVKFWDLETFELIGSAGPESSGVCAMSFNPDGKTLLCGLHESLKVFSWEPVRCHDAVDVGWSRLSDLNVHEGKLLGCSYNQSCVGVWVVDVLRIEPYAITGSVRSSNGNLETRSSSTGNGSFQSENSVRASIGRLSVSQNSDLGPKETKSTALNVPNTPQRAVLSTGPKINTASSAAALPTSNSVTTLKKIGMTTKDQPVSLNISNKQADIVPVIVPRSSTRVEQAAAESKKEFTSTGRAISYSVQPRITDFRKLASHCRDNSDVLVQSGSMDGCKSSELNEVVDQNFRSATGSVTEPTNGASEKFADNKCMMQGRLRVNLSREPSANVPYENYVPRVRKPSGDSVSAEVLNEGRTRTLVSDWEKREQSPTDDGPDKFGNINKEICAASSTRASFNSRERYTSREERMISASDEDAIVDLVEQHDRFLDSMQSRLTKLQVIRRFSERNDFRGAINALEKMSDHAVLADVTNVWTEKSDFISLDVFSCFLPLLTSLLHSSLDRYIGISLEMLVKLVNVFGPMIRSTLSASSSVGVDLQAEERLERCHLCFIELEKIKLCLPTLTRKGGSVGKFAHELSLSLLEGN